MSFHEALSLKESVLQSDTQDSSDSVIHYTFVLMFVTWINQHYYYRDDHKVFAFLDYSEELVSNLLVEFGPTSFL